MAKGKRKTKEREQKVKAQIRRRFEKRGTKLTRSKSVDIGQIAIETQEYLRAKVKPEPGVEERVEIRERSKSLGSKVDLSKVIKQEVLNWRLEYEKRREDLRDEEPTLDGTGSVITSGLLCSIV